MKSLTAIIIGIIIMLISSFGGSYIIHILGFDNWLIFPSMLTLTLTFFGGAFVFACGAATHKWY